MKYDSMIRGTTGTTRDAIADSKSLAQGLAEGARALSEVP